MTSIIEDICNLYANPNAQKTVQKYGMTINRVAWLDSERYIGSVWGKSITDFTLMVKLPNGLYQDVSIIRDGSNFKDNIRKISLDSIKIPVKINEELKVISLKEYLDTIHTYIPNRSDYCHYKLLQQLEGRTGDAEILISAQASILPVMNDEHVNFHIRVDTYGRNVLIITASK